LGGRCIAAWASLFALLAPGCGGGNDYYAIADMRGEGDTLELEFVYTCGVIDISWDGKFVDMLQPRAELTIDHDDLGSDCDESPRWVPFDTGPMKREFRAAHHPWPAPLGVRVAPYEEEQGARCVRNLFQDAPFRGKICE
jgi:hypothetical protein